jgi:hypothetical protein
MKKIYRLKIFEFHLILYSAIIMNLFSLIYNKDQVNWNYQQRKIK